MKIAIVSDLHIGDGARSPDFMVNSSADIPNGKFLEKFCKFIADNELSADYLIVPGDITNRAEVAEFKLGSKIIEAIADELKVSSTNIIFTPGNHDSSWEQIDRARDDGVNPENRCQYALLPMLQDKTLIFNKQLRSADGCFDEPPFFATWSFDDAIFICINSSVSISRDDSHKSGSVSSEQIAAINSWLERNKDVIADKLKVAVVHHHPINYHDTTFTAPDVTALQNSIGLLDLLSSFSFDLFIHGHKHIPRFYPFANAIGCPINLICAGSFSARLPEDWYGTVGNMFHLLEIHSRDDRSRLAKGLLKTWSFHMGHGWIQSVEKFNAVPHMNYFGNFMPIHEAKDHLRQAIAREFGESPIIRWEQLANSDPIIRYLPNKQLLQALTELSQSEQFDLMGVEKGYLGAFNQLALIKQAKS